MAAQTTNYDFWLPTVGADADNWGGYLNTNFETLDELLSGTATITGITVVDAASLDTDALTARSGALSVVSITGANANVLGLSISQYVQEAVQTVVGNNPTMNPNAGTIVSWSPADGAACVPAISIDASGKSFLLMMTIGATLPTITWSGVTWINGAPSLEVNKVAAIVFWRVAAVTYGSMVGLS